MKTELLAVLAVLAFLAAGLSASAQVASCPLPEGSLIRIPRPGPGNLVVCADDFITGFDVEKVGPHCVHVCDGIVTGSLVRSRPHPASAGTDFIDGRGLWLAPGFVDLRSSVGLTDNPNEESTEVSPALSALDFVDPADPRFEQARRAGVTSVAVVPGGRAALGGLVAVIKTDDRALAQRVLHARVALSATLGYEPAFGNRSPRRSPPTSYYFRRPANRMGLIAELERSFFAARHGLLHDPVEEAVLSEAMSGRLPTFFRARKEADIRAALRLAEDFGLRPVILEGTEAWRHAELLAGRGVPVVLGPLYQQPRGGLERWEGDDPRSAIASILDEAGVRIAFASGPDDPPGSLREWALLSVRHGLPRHEAVLALSSRPAEILGLEERIGRISWGNDADLVLLDAHPMDPTARVLMTIVEGRVAWRDPDAPELSTVPLETSSPVPPGSPR